MGLGGHTCWVEEGKGREERVKFHKHGQCSYYPGQPHHPEADRETLLEGTLMATPRVHWIDVGSAIGTAPKAGFAWKLSLC